MKKIIMAGLITVCVLAAAAQERASRPLPRAGATTASAAPAPIAPAVSLRLPVSSCAEPTGDARAELKQALALVKSNASRSAVLAKLLANRPHLQATGEQLKEWRESLPAEFKTRLLTRKEVAANPSFGRALDLARRISREFGFKDQFLIFYQSEKPLVANWKKHFVLVSSKAVELLSEAEVAGQIANESAHLLYWDELEQALEKGDFRTARIIELKCDLVAMMMLERLKLDPQALPSGLAVMINWLAARQQIEPVPTHPGLCARIKLAEEFARTFKSDSGVVPAVAKPSLSPETGALYLEAKIYYGENDEKITFVGRESFILLDENLVEILQKNNFRIGAESNLDASAAWSAGAIKEIGHSSSPVHKNRLVRKNSRERHIAAAIDPQETFDVQQNAYLAAAVDLLGGEANGAVPETNRTADDERSLLLMLFEAAIKTHRIAAGETNEWGMGVLAHLKPGRYYLFGFTRTERETLVWHLPLELRAGNNELELDQYNTANIFEN